jgi:hypothetical protein
VKYSNVFDQRARQRECAKDRVKEQSFVERLYQNRNRIDALEQIPGVRVIATGHHYHWQIVPSDS